VTDHGLPLGLIAPACMDHPLLQALSPSMLERSTRDCTVLMLLNAGSFQASLWRLGARYSVPLFGSSANLSVSGTKIRVENIEPEVIRIAGVIIDYGLRRWHLYRAFSTSATAALCAKDRASRRTRMYCDGSSASL
jgi:hypothetical protein